MSDSNNMLAKYSKRSFKVEAITCHLLIIIENSILFLIKLTLFDDLILILI